MNDTDKQPHANDPEDWPTRWDWFFFLDPVLWGSALIALGITYAFDIPRDSQLAIFVFVASLISVFAIFKIVMVYILGRSLKRGTAAPKKKPTRTSERVEARKRRAERIP